MTNLPDLSTVELLPGSALILTCPAQITEAAPYGLASPTRIKFVGPVECFHDPALTQHARTYTDGRSVDVIEERGRAWCVYRGSYELWCKAAVFIYAMA